jgi:hypothetical protein
VAPWSEGWVKFSSFKPVEMKAAGKAEILKRYPHIAAKERRV